MRVIGTAGHVDHGKSSLVRAITGIDPDRLKEEKERQMTIDLGFAWGELPGEVQVGFVDVPGHRDFIENMLAGVGGIDAALFVVAADEGVMPQTREHLAILDLLDISNGVVALTKVDLVEDEEWLALVEEDVRQLFRGTSLANSEVVRVSTRSGFGIEKLAGSLAAAVTRSPEPTDVGSPRLPIDRAFTISGFGTVVTGTLLDGALKVGQPVRILPGSAEGRVRGLQTHREDVELAKPGTRVAVNVSGLEVQAVSRGDVLTTDAVERPTRRLEVSVRVLRSAAVPIEHNQELKLFIGAAQRMARVRSAHHTAIEPGETEFMELQLDRAVLARRGDRYILRRPSPAATLGGGRVADPHPRRRRHRMDASERSRLEQLLSPDPQEVILGLLRGFGPVGTEGLARAGNLPSDVVDRALQGLISSSKVEALSADDTDQALFVDRQKWHEIRSDILAVLDSYHQRHRLRAGMPTEELRAKVGLAGHVFSLSIERLTAEGDLRVEGGLGRLVDFVVRLTAEEQGRADRLMAELAREPHAPPSASSLQSITGPELYRYMVLRGDVIPVSEEVVFSREAYESMVKTVCQAIASEGPRTVADLRDLLDTSRKYTLALLEHMDRLGITVRKGDVRELLNAPDQISR